MTELQHQIGNIFDDILKVIPGHGGAAAATKPDPGDTQPGAPAKDNAALYQVIVYLTNLLNTAGIPKAVQVYCIAQILYETAGLTSNLARNSNNFSGIKYINKSYQKNAHAAGNGYAGFDTVHDWANDYARILSLSPGKPINATNAQDFFNGLIANHYFGEKPAVYSAGFNTWLKKVNTALNQAQATWSQVQATGSGTAGNWTAADTLAAKGQEMKAAWAGLSTPVKVGVGLAAVFIAVKIFED